MNVFNAYVYSTAGWTATQALGLLISPKFSIAVLSQESRGPTGSILASSNLIPSANILVAVEVYLARALGISLFALAVLTVLFTGVVPLTLEFAEHLSADESNSKSPYAIPTVTISMCFQATMAFYCYSRYLHTGLSIFALDVAVYSGLGAMGLWCLLFANSGSKISRRTGADKRTSGFPFTNVEADKRKVGKKRL
ncbi:hypothetical protein MMC11_006809 [Xylographa trunciseda]|nr:hypothetical protein [Xylographa trunciseda]